MPKYTDDELRTLTDLELASALGANNSKLSEDRRKALSYYLGNAEGDLAAPTIPGRSSVVSTDVSDTIEWMLPALLEIFTAGDDAVEFAPQGVEDEQAAAQATQYINYVFYRQNTGWMSLYTWFKDALLQKNGILKVYWQDNKDVSEENYYGFDEAAIGILMQDPEIQIKELFQAGTDEFTGMPLFDVVALRIKDMGQVKVEAVPPEEFLISAKAKSISTSTFVAHRVERTISELKEAGYKNVDEITSDESIDSDSEYITRHNDYGLETEDLAERRVWLTECYVKLDYDDDGNTHWRKIVRSGNQILENERVDFPPFVSICPIPLSHKFFGRSVADLAIETQKTKTSLMRATLDGLYQSINGRTFAVEGQVNLDDLMTARPGGIVRVKNVGAVGPLQEGMPNLNAGLSMLEYMETVKENRTGWTRYSQGTSADSLNKTATGMNIITNKSDMRVQLIARVFAETGVKDLFNMILALVTKYQNKSSVIRLTNEWVQIDPSEWRNKFDFVINVGLGTGNKDQIVQRLMSLLSLQKEAVQVGLATPQNLYNTAAKLVQQMGFKSVEQFFVDPSKQEGQGNGNEQQPDPKMIEVQQKAQIEQQRFELDKWRIEQEMNLKREELIAQIKLKEMEFALKSTPQTVETLSPIFNSQAVEQVNNDDGYGTGRAEQVVAGNQQGADGENAIGTEAKHVSEDIQLTWADVCHRLVDYEAANPDKRITLVTFTGESPDVYQGKRGNAPVIKHNDVSFTLDDGSVIRF